MLALELLLFKIYSSTRRAVVVFTLSCLAKAKVSSFNNPFLVDLYVLKYGVLRELGVFVSFKTSTSSYEEFLQRESKVKLIIVSSRFLDRWVKDTLESYDLENYPFLDKVTSK